MSFSVSYSFLAIDKFTNVARKISAASKKIGISMKSLGSGMRKAGQKMKKTGKAMQSFGQGMILKMTAPTLGAAVAFSKFESGLTNVQTLMGKKEIDKFGAKLEKIQEKAVKMGFTIEDTSKALFDTVSALGASDKSIRTFAVAQKLAIGGVTDISTAVDGLTSIINAYGKDTVKASDVANAFFSAQRAGKTTVGALSSNVGKIAPIAKAAGVGFKELLSAMSQLTLGGLSTEEGTTALRGALSALIKPGKQARKIFQGLAQRGIVIPFGAAKIKAAGLAKVLFKLAEANKKYPDAVALAIPNIRAFTALMAFGAKEVENMQRIQASINTDIRNGTGLNKAYNKQLKIMTSLTKRLFGRLKLWGKQIVADLAPAIKTVLKFLIKWIDKYGKLTPRTKKIMSIIVAMVAVIGPLIFTFGLLISSIGFILAGFSSLVAFLGAAGIGLGAIVGPVVLITAAVVALGAALLAVIVYWKEIKEFFKSEKFRQFFSFEDPTERVPQIESLKGLDSQAARSPLGALRQSPNKLDGNLNINFRGDTENVKSADFSSDSDLNVGILGVGQPLRN